MPRCITEQTIQWRPDKPAVKPWQHGTITGYSYGCRGDSCREAITQYTIELQRRRAANRRIINGRLAQLGLPPIGPEKHNGYTYNNWYCRCEECTDDRAERQRNYRATGHAYLSRA